MRPSVLTTLELLVAATRSPAEATFAAEPHATEAVDWLVRAQRPNGGLSQGFALLRGWLPSDDDPALVATLYDAGAVLDRPELAPIAEALAKRVVASPPKTVIGAAETALGLLRAWKETGDRTYSEAAIKAGDFLVAEQDADGAWRKLGEPCAYHARAGWALLQLAKATSEIECYLAGKRALDWAVAQQNTAGWFAHNQPARGGLPTTGTIASVARSLVEGFAHTGDDACWDAASRAVDRLLGKLAERGFIPARHDARFADGARAEDVGGTVQTALTALRMFQLRGDRRHLDGGLLALTHVGGLVRAGHRNPGVRGAVPGSWPVFGTPMPMRFPSASTKLWVDALMLADALEVRRRLEPIGRRGAVLEDRYNT